MATGRTTTLRDVAQQAGVSVATASRVMRGDEVVGAGTKIRVLSAIAELQYFPNGNAVELSKKRRGARKHRLSVHDGTHVRIALENGSEASNRHIESAESQKAANLRLRRLIKSMLKDIAKWTLEVEFISGSNGAQSVAGPRAMKNALELPHPPMDPIDVSAKTSERSRSIHRTGNSTPK